MRMSEVNQSAHFAGLAQQVTNLEGDYRDLKTVVISLDRKLDASMAAISAKLDESREPKWQAYGVMLTVILAVCALAWLPLRESQNDLKAAIKTLSEGVVYVKRYENNQQSIKELMAERQVAAQRQIDDMRARVQALEAKK